MGSVQFAEIFKELIVSNDLTIKYVAGSLFYIFGILLIAPMTFFWLIYLIWVFDKKIKINKDEPIIIEKYKFWMVFLFKYWKKHQKYFFTNLFWKLTF